MEFYLPRATAESILKHLAVSQLDAVNAVQRAIAGELLTGDEGDEIVGALEALMETGSVEERDRLKSLRDSVHDAIG